jgi:HEAT repeat protein
MTDSHFQKLRAGLILGLAAGLLIPATGLADGFFVAPDFVWNKHKDINEPTQKAIIVYDAGREDLILQVKYDGPVEEFGWLVPIPNLPTVQKGSMRCFYELSRYTQVHFEPRNAVPGDAGDASLSPDNKPTEPVEVIETKTVGAYEVAVLSTRDAGALENWLAANGFSYPRDKAGVLDAYVKQHWYFIATRIRLGKGNGFQIVTGAPRQALEIKSELREKLASGELHPMQISFASDRCVFPLRISSINGRSSEVQVLVLSGEPLMEKGMFEKELPEAYRLDRKQAAINADNFRKGLLSELKAQYGDSPPPLTAADERRIQRMRETPAPVPNDFPPFIQVTTQDLPDCSRQIPRLAGKSWWLTKQTWTFQPEEMRDLEFQPAIPVFAGELGTQYGYSSARGLASLGTEAVPVLITALQSRDPVARVQAASVINPLRDPRLAKCLPELFKDSESEVRRNAALAAQYNWNSGFVEPLISLFRDNDDEVRQAATACLEQHPEAMAGYVPVFRELLEEPNLEIKASALRMLVNLREKFSRAELLQLAAIPQNEVVGMAVYELGDTPISDTEAVPLLHNPEPLARIFGLIALLDNANTQSVDLALPLLNDPNVFVKKRAAAILRVLTGQHFPPDQPTQWDKWWAANRATFTVAIHPEELHPKRVQTNPEPMTTSN